MQTPIATGPFILLCTTLITCSIRRLTRNSAAYLVLQAAYGLVAGDSLVFGRLPTGELVAAGKIRAEGALPLTQAAPQKIVVNLDRSRRRRRTQVPYDPSDPGASHGGAERASTAEMPEEVGALSF